MDEQTEVAEPAPVRKECDLDKLLAEIEAILGTEKPCHPISSRTHRKRGRPRKSETTQHA